MTDWDTETLAQKLKDNPDLAQANIKGVARKVANSGKAVGLASGKGKLSSGHKYRAIPTEYRGRRYPSKKQAEKAEELDLLKLAGKIKGFIEEVSFRLPGNSRHRVDFGVIELDNTVTWIEVKGRDLQMGKLKRRQVEELYHIKIKVV